MHPLSPHLKEGMTVVQELFDSILPLGINADPDTVRGHCKTLTAWLDGNGSSIPISVKNAVIGNVSKIHSRWQSSIEQRNSDVDPTPKKLSPKAVEISGILAKHVPILNKDELGSYVKYPDSIMADAIRNYIAYGDIYALTNATNGNLNYYDVFMVLGSTNKQESLLELAPAIEAFINDHDTEQKQIRLGIAMTGFLYGLYRYGNIALNTDTLSEQTHIYFGEMYPYLQLALDHLSGYSTRFESGLVAMQVGLTQWGNAILNNDHIISMERNQNKNFLAELYSVKADSFIKYRNQESTIFQLAVNTKTDLTRDQIQDIKPFLSYALTTKDPNYSIKDLRLNKHNCLQILDVALSVATRENDNGKDEIRSNVNIERLGELVLETSKLKNPEKIRLLRYPQLTHYLAQIKEFKRDLLERDMGL